MDIIKLVLVDDHPIFARGLHMLLNNVSDFKVVGEASNGDAFLAGLYGWQPDVVLMDIKMPGMDGVTATREALKRQADLKVIALTMFGEPHYCRLMAEAGARGFVEKNVSGAELEKAIRLVFSGNNYFSRQMIRDLSENPHSDEPVFITQLGEKLSERELEVLFYIVKGLSAQEIAGKMFLSPRTIEGHRANLISKTGTRNVVELVIYAIRHKLVEL